MPDYTGVHRQRIADVYQAGRLAASGYAPTHAGLPDYTGVHRQRLYDIYQALLAAARSAPPSATNAVTRAGTAGAPE